MVVGYLHDPYRGDPSLVETSGWELWQWIVFRFEDEARWPPEVESILAGPVGNETVEAPRRGADIGQRRRRPKDGQTPPQDRPLLSAEASGSGAIVLAVLREPSIGPDNVNRSFP